MLVVAEGSGGFEGVLASIGVGCAVASIGSGYCLVEAEVEVVDFDVGGCGCVNVVAWRHHSASVSRCVAAGVEDGVCRAINFLLGSSLGCSGPVGEAQDGRRVDEAGAVAAEAFACAVVFVVVTPGCYHRHW